MRGIKVSDNILVTLHEKGIGMTFDSDGIPIIQKHMSNSNAIVEKPDYDLSSEFLVTKITKK